MELSELLPTILLGVIEGLTEFIPVSSTGHLIIFSHFSQLDDAKTKTLEIFIQLGAILAVVVLYPHRFTALIKVKGVADEQSFSGRPGLTKLFLACLPVFVVGALFHEMIKERLFNATSVAVALIVGGVVLVLVEMRKQQHNVTSVERISYLNSFIVGCVQCASLWPGISRSASTIIAGLLLGFERKVAAEFSFIVAVPVMVAAVTFDLWKSRQLLELSDLVPFLVGFFVSFVTAVVSIKFFILLVGRLKLTAFGIYRILLGLLVMGLVR